MLGIAVDRTLAHPVHHDLRATVRYRLGQFGEAAHQPLQPYGISGSDGDDVVGIGEGRQRRSVAAWRRRVVAELLVLLDTESAIDNGEGR